MTYSPKVSVIVPVRNAEESIEDCIHSLLELDYPKEKVELIVVNNGSTDGTAGVLRRYGSHLRILYEEKRGPAAARNKGLLNARGEIIAFTDSDCVVDKGWLRNIVAPLEDESVGIVGGKNLSKRPCNAVEEFGEYIHDHNSAITLYRPPYVITMNWSSRLAMLKELNLFDEALLRCEDVDLSYRIYDAGYTLAFKPEAVVYHSNESTLRGLFREGFLHGFYSVQAIKKHRVLLKRFGHRRFNGRAYLALVTSLGSYIRGQNADHSICHFVFNAGKKVGKIFGSVKFLHLDL